VHILQFLHHLLPESLNLTLQISDHPPPRFAPGQSPGPITQAARLGISLPGRLAALEGRTVVKPQWRGRSGRKDIEGLRNIQEPQRALRLPDAARKEQFLFEAAEFAVKQGVAFDSFRLVLSRLRAHHVQLLVQRVKPPTIHLRIVRDLVFDALQRQVGASCTCTNA